MTMHRRKQTVDISHDYDQKPGILYIAQNRGYWKHPMWRIDTSGMAGVWI